jgi:hypothetical protein
MKAKFIKIFILALAMPIVSLIVAEGIRSIYLGKKFHIGLLAQSLFYLKKEVIEKHGKPDGNSGLRPPLTAGKYPFLEQRSELGKFIPQLQEINAGVGNTDFYELISENSSVNGHGKCQGMKPNLKKEMIHLRSITFDQYDPPMIFHDSGIKVPAPLREFIEKYQFSRKILSTNEFGERVTVPKIEKARKVLVAGDSVAMGIALGDEETLSARLQQMDDSRQYVNLGVSGAGPSMIFCLLEEAAARYPSAIDELIYVFCDNDFPELQQEGGAALVVKKIKEFQVRNQIKKIVMVRSPLVYSIPPLMDRSEEAHYIAQEVETLSRESTEVGFSYIDFRDIALEETKIRESMYAYHHLFIDRVHYSPDGTRLLAKKIRRR